MIVRMPDGTPVSFPDNMPKEQIQGLIASKFPNEVKGIMQQPSAQTNQQPESGMSSGEKRLGRLVSAGQGVFFGLPVLDETYGALRGGSEYAANKLINIAGGNAPKDSFSDLYAKHAGDIRDIEKRQIDEEPGRALALNLLGSGVTGLAASGTKAAAAAGDFLRSGNRLTRIAKGLGAGSATGGSYGFAAGEGENRTREAIKGGITGGSLGAAVPAVGAAYSGVKAIGAPKIEKAVADLAQRAQEFGIPLRLDQISPTRVRSTVQKISQQIPGSGVDAFENTQRQAFTRAVAKTIGEDAESLSPQTVNTFIARNSEVFDRLLSGRQINVSAEDLNSIVNLKNSINSTLGITSRDSGILKREIDGIAQQLKGENITGELLGNIRSDVLKKSTGSSIGRDIFSDIIGKIDDIAKKNMTEEGAQALSEARRQYRNFKTIEPLLEKSTDGMINPTELISRVKASKYIKASRSELGKDDLVDLARIGKQFLPKKEGSDTAQKVVLIAGVEKALTNPLAILGGGAAAGGVPGAAATGGAMLLNRGYQKGINQSNRLIDLAIRNSGKAARKVDTPASAVLIPGIAGAKAVQ